MFLVCYFGLCFGRCFLFSFVNSPAHHFVCKEHSTHFRIFILSFVYYGLENKMIQMVRRKKKTIKKVVLCEHFFFRVLFSEISIFFCFVLIKINIVSIYELKIWRNRDMKSTSKIMFVNWKSLNRLQIKSNSSIGNVNPIKIANTVSFSWFIFKHKQLTQ